MACDVHDDEPRAPRRRPARRRHRRTRHAAGDRLRARAPARPRRPECRRRNRRRSSPIPTSSGCCMTMRALTQAARTICYATAMALDRAERGNDKAARQTAHARASLLTPVAKAYSTDIGIEVASIGVQVHGGMGFIEETGAAQLFSRRADRADLRRHQRHPGDRSRDPQAAAQRRRRGGIVSSANCAALSKQSTRPTIRRSAGAACGSTRPSKAWRERPHWLLAKLDKDTDEALAGATPVSAAVRSGRPAAACWRSRRSPHCGSTPMPARASHWRDSSPKILRYRRRRLNAPWSKVRRP